MINEIYVYTYMGTFIGSTSETQRQKDVEQVINIQIYTIFYNTKYYKNFVKHYYISYLHTKFNPQSKGVCT